MCFCGLFSIRASAFDKELVPMGCVVGLQLQADGVVVAGLSSGDSGAASPAGQAGILPGDIIVKLGGQCVTTAEDFISAAGMLDGSATSLTVRRGDRAIQFTVTPVQASDGVWRLGLILRDGITGVGTVTFIEPDTGFFGALGHGVPGCENGEMLPLSSGFIADAEIVDVQKGTPGTPGELHGTFDLSSIKGSIDINSSCGIFGTMSTDTASLRDAVPVASASEIELGSAVILANVSGADVKEYTIEITRLYKNDSLERDMMISVTDPALLEATGGIVQGMSGSPILQNGKLIGAVTHVLVNDPARGYGISIENMLQMSKSGAENAADAA